MADSRLFNHLDPSSTNLYLETEYMDYHACVDYNVPCILCWNCGRQAVGLYSSKFSFMSYCFVCPILMTMLFWIRKEVVHPKSLYKLSLFIAVPLELSFCTKLSFFARFNTQPCLALLANHRLVADMLVNAWHSTVV